MPGTSVHFPDNPQYRELKEFIAQARHTPGPLIQVLHRAQGIFGYLPREVQCFVAEQLSLPVSKVFGVVTFYSFFRTKPLGKYVINICLGTACHVKGASDLVAALEEALQVANGDTTADGLFTLSSARCFGACGLAPAMMINDEVYGRLDVKKTLAVINRIRSAENNQ